MLTRTVSFYNAEASPTSIRQSGSCHAYPNGKLLQRVRCKKNGSYKVVMLTRTVSFYNTILVIWGVVVTSCHAYPNGKLLQLTTMASL